MDRPRGPVMIYDGDCGFCRLWIERWWEITGDDVTFVASQDVGHLYPEIDPARFEASVLFVDDDGEVSEGADAVFRALATQQRWRWLHWLYRRAPGFRPGTELLYAMVAGNRVAASRVTRLLWGDEVRRPGYQLVRFLFLRGLGVTYLCAFFSLWVQLDGLVGSQGILPAAPWLDAVWQRNGVWSLLYAPTVLWLGAGDLALSVVGATGIVLSIALILGRAPLIATILLWACYLSLYTVGRTFLSFQWDILLLETGFIAIFLAPLQLRPELSRERAAPRIPMWLLRWLLFRLLWLSGLVKLASGDEAWWNLTALSFHYETQPLPTWIGWYAHNLPMWVHRISAAWMFVVELIVPFLIFGPRRVRLAAFAIIVWFQIAIMATGNYGFFNLLTCLLAVSLLDDAYLRRLLPARYGAAVVAREGGNKPRLVRATALGVVAATLVMMSTAQGVGRIYGYDAVPATMRTILRWTGPFHLTSSYGLFSVMTKSRPEIVIEGSNDGKQWTAYEFRWKPGDLAARPRFVAPHQPRLDWQMWFAALGNYRSNPWLITTMRRLLEGSEPVLALLADNPFPERPPRQIRAMVYDYRFTSAPTRRAEGRWWKRERPRLYAPVLTRK